MCTVTFLPIKNGFILSSSRDEKTFRETLPIEKYKHINGDWVYPMDITSGGTWIGYSQANKLACLLNGGFQKHQSNPPYDRSRGKVLLESLEYENFSTFYSKADLNNVEPFTLLMIDFKQSIEFEKLVWDGEKKTIESIDTNLPQIWSSATLYDAESIKKREFWFSRWMDIHKKAGDLDMKNFHLKKHVDDETINVLMSRSDILKTVSLTQFINQSDHSKMSYLDLIKDTEKVMYL